MSVKTQEEYEKDLKDKFPTANFTILEYSGLQKKMIIRCNDCGETRSFKRAAYLLPKQKFCSRCASSYYQAFSKICQDNLIAIESYNGVAKNAELKCLRCEKCFKKIPSNGVQKGQVLCPYCQSPSPAHQYIDWPKRIAEVFGEDNYQIVEDDFVGTDRIHIKHKCGFTFPTRIYDFIKGQGCPACSGHISKGALQICHYLDYHKIPYELEYPIQELGQRFDFWINNTIALEYQGEYHYRSSYGEERLQRVLELDQQKKLYCQLHNIPLYYITFKQQKQIEEILATLPFNDQPPGVNDENKL